MKRTARTLPLILLALVGACSPVSDQAERDELPLRTKFSDEDRRIARTLSVGSNSIRGDASPQYRAMVCNLALATIADRMRVSGVLTQEQQKAFAQAQSLYRRRSEAGLSMEERDQLQSDVEATYPNDSDRAKSAIECLRDMGEAQS